MLRNHASNTPSTLSHIWRTNLASHLRMVAQSCGDSRFGSITRCREHLESLRAISHVQIEQAARRGPRGGVGRRRERPTAPRRRREARGEPRAPLRPVPWAAPPHPTQSPAPPILSHRPRCSPFAFTRWLRPFPSPLGSPFAFATCFTGRRAARGGGRGHATPVGGAGQGQDRGPLRHARRLEALWNVHSRAVLPARSVCFDD